MKFYLVFGLFTILCLFCSCKKDPPPVNASPAVKAYLEEQESSSSPWGYIDKQGHAVIEAKYDAARPFSEGCAAVAKKGLWHIINKDGQVINPGPFINIGLFQNNLVVCKGLDAKTGIINRQGDTIAAFAYDDIFPSDEGFFVTQQGHSQGLLDEKGEEIKSPSFSSIKFFDKDHLILEHNNQFILWNSKTNVEIPLDIDRYVGHGVCVKDRRYFVVDNLGKKTSTEFKKIWRLNDDMIIVKNEDKRYGFMKLNGEVIIPMEYEKIKKLSDTRLAVRKLRRYALFDIEGHQLSDFKFQQFMQFDEGLAPIELDKAWGYMDEQGKIAIPPHLYLPWKCKEGLIRYYNRDGFGYMSKTGKNLIPSQFRESRDFHEGLAAFQK